MQHRKNDFTWHEIESSLKRIHEHNEMFKKHFEEDRSDGIGFIKRITDASP